MQVFLTHPIGIDRGKLLLFSDFEDGGAMWTGKGPRLIRRSVPFSRAFHAPPEVMLSIDLWDADTTFNLRAELVAENIGKERFDLVFKTWGDSRFARVRVDWTAIGAVPNVSSWQL